MTRDVGTSTRLAEREADRRIERACDLIEAAYRLHPFNPKNTLDRVRTAIKSGADQLAEDINEEASRA